MNNMYKPITYICEPGKRKTLEPRDETGQLKELF